MKPSQKYAGAFALIVLLQLVVFYLVERYLTPNTDAGIASTAAAAAQAQNDLTPPSNVLLFDTDPKGKRIAFYGNHEQLVVRDRKAALAVVNLPGVHFLQWTDAGKTLFYMREIYGKNEMGVFKVAENKLVPLHDIFARNITMEQLFKSSYSQSINFIYKQGRDYQVGFYEAIFGFRSAPLDGKPANASFDEKEDLLTIETAKGKTLQYRHGTFVGEVKKAAYDTLKEPKTTQRGELLQ